MKNTNSKETFFRIGGIAGLFLLLVLFIWLDRPIDTAKSSSAQGHDHADPIQHGAKLEKGEISKAENMLKPSGELNNGKRLVDFEAFQYGFSPDPLVVKSGEQVVLTVKSRDVEHGMLIPQIDFSTNITKTAKKVTFTAPVESGKYVIFCSVYCGSSHGDMKGSLIVLPRKEVAPKQKADKHEH